jgi:hypothetical protein
MSWLFSQAAAEEFSAGTSLDGERFAQLNVLPTPHPFWHKGKPMNASDHSQFGQTLQVLTESHGAELLMSFLAAFPAKTSAQRDSEKESKAPGADCGRKWPGLLAKFDPDTRLWRTAQHSLLGDSEPFLATWPQWGSMLDGECWAHEMPALPISATASGYSLPTPSGVNAGRNHTMGRVDEWGGSSNPLRGTVVGSMCLPEFEEMVMGWPVMWTALTPFGMDKFREWSHSHGGL